MKTTIEYLDEIARRYPRRDGSPASDYGLADLLGVSAQAISKYRQGHSRFDESVAIRAAELLEIDPALVLLDTVAAGRNVRRRARSGSASRSVSPVARPRFFWP